MAGTTNKKTNNTLGVVLSGFIFFLLIIPLLIISGTVLYFQQTERIAPWVTVGPVQVGMLTVDDAALEINEFWNATPHFVVADGKNSWSVPPPNIGLWIDPLATARLAFDVGRDAGGFEELLALAQEHGYDVQPVVNFNRQLALDVFNQLAGLVDVPAQDASLSHNDDGQWQALPGQPGLGLDVQAAVDQLAGDPDGMLAGGVLQLSLNPVAPHIADLSSEINRIAAYYQKPLNLRAYDAITDELINWQVPQDLVSSWVVLDDPYGEPYLKVDQEAFQRYLNEWQQSIGNREIESMDAVDTLDDNWHSGEDFNLMLRHKPTEYTVQSGDNLVRIGFVVGMPYWKIQTANPGTSIYSVYAGQVLTIPSKNEMLPLPVVVGKRIVISITDQHMWVYENWQLKSEHVISTGMSNSPTLPGVFQIQTHEINAYASNWDLWMPNFMGIYEAVPGFMNGIHGLPLLSNGVRLWGNVLGRKASYGCIILDLQAGEDLYNWAENGVVVEIQP
jgi:lipoprotein-anchoring transpeptidase ErfK/SrfK